MLNLILLILLTLSGRSSDELLSLIQAENSFSALSSEKGIRTAFITYFDDEAIVFAPKPVKGRERYINSDSIPGHLQWNPQFADISSSGNIGYTTGPWKRHNNSKVSFGHFVSIWEKKNKGWKVILDTGIDYGEPYTSVTEVISSSVLSHGSYASGKSEEKKLFTLDKTINSSGLYKNNLSQDIMLFRPGKHPLIGITPVLNFINELSPSFSVKQEFQRISDAGDLAYSYGYFLYNNNMQDCYLRIWKKSNTGDWKLALELAKSVK